MAESIGSAYLNIVPKMDKGADSEIKSELSSVDMGGVGSSWGKSLGLSMVKGLAALGIGKFVADTLRESFDQYAEYEQLVGGVETLFKDSADVVQEYAENAYKTAGLSANEYMDMATSFSATLIKSLDGDTEAAARYVDMAITDMSDNANKMGTDINSLQMAYQSLARGNAGMLDNLKIGYGGTHKELLSLVKDMGIVDESVQSFEELDFVDVIEAIHKMQDELGITGTTSLEAATTIQGSVTMASAAWKNWVTGLANENADMQKLTDDLVQSLTMVVANSGPIIKQLIQSFVQSLPGLIQGLIPTIKEIVVELPGVIVEILPDLLEAGVELIQAIGEGVVEMIPDLVDKFIEIGEQLIQGLIDGFESKVAPFLELIGGTVGDAAEAAEMVAQIASPSKRFRKIGNYMIEGLTLGIEDETPNAIAAVEKAIGFGDGMGFSATYGTTTSVVGAINALHSDLGKIINEYSPNSIDATRSYLGELQRKAAMIA